MKTDLYDALTLEIERADVLTEHLADRLEALSTSASSTRFSLIAQDIRAKHALIVERAKALLRSRGGQ